MSTIGPDAILPATWVLERLRTMSKFVKDMGSSNHSAEYILPEIIDHIARLRRTILHSSSGPSTIAIGGAIELRPVDLTVERVASVFELLVPARVDAATYEFKFYVKSLEVPAFLNTVLSNLNRSSDYNEISARAGVDFLIMDARQALERDNLLNAEAKRLPQLRMITDFDLRIKAFDPITEQDIVMAGHADWAVGYGSGDDISCTFLGVLAKNPDSFSGMYLQLLGSLAIARERRIRQRMKDVEVQGVLTDGVLYRFVIIERTGRVRQSAIYELFLEGNLRIIYTFIYWMLHAAMFCSQDITDEEDEEVMDEDEDEDEDENEDEDVEVAEE